MRIHQMLGWAAGGCVLVASLTLASRYSRPKQVRAALVVTPESPLVFAKEGETKVDLEFRVKNQTNHDIKLGEMHEFWLHGASISPGNPVSVHLFGGLPRRFRRNPVSEESGVSSSFPTGIRRR